MWLIVVYSPALVLLPVVFLIVFFLVLFSGGLLIVLGATYFLAMGFLGLVGFATRRRRTSSLVARLSPSRITQARARATAIR